MPGDRPLPATLHTPRLPLRSREPENAAWNLELLAERDGGTTLALADRRAGLAQQLVDTRQGGLGFFAMPDVTAG
jgi:hypothetical protein